MGFLPSGHRGKSTGRFCKAELSGLQLPLASEADFLWRARGGVSLGRDYDLKIVTMSNEALTDEARRRLAAAAPAAEVILFASRARNEGRPGSDLDLLEVLGPRRDPRRRGSYPPGTRKFARLIHMKLSRGRPIDLADVAALTDPEAEP